MASSISPLAAAIAQARRTRVYPRFDPALALPDVADAYGVQAQVATLTKAGVAGWKVGVLPDGDGWAAPIFAADTLADGAAFDLPGVVKLEVELALRLRRDLPPRAGRPYTRADILDATAEMFVGLELVGTRFDARDELPFATRLGDNFANAAYAIGGGVASFANLDLAQLRCRLAVDGVTLSDRHGGHPMGDPLAPVIAWASTQCDALGGLRAGQYITTGTLTEPAPLERAARIEASLDGIGAVHITTRMG